VQRINERDPVFGHNLVLDSSRPGNSCEVRVEGVKLANAAVEEVRPESRMRRTALQALETKSPCAAISSRHLVPGIVPRLIPPLPW
jgi:hypothetical protein